ncbi:hypothetical protein [Nonomuraea sp. NPDC049695]|uniref:hypothetical protein n=1 Tax=Nonomuraea sp. NPDC049695 TaxID=3154734 RepID=UPI00341A5280
MFATLAITINHVNGGRKADPAQEAPHRRTVAVEPELMAKPVRGHLNLISLDPAAAFQPGHVQEVAAPAFLGAGAGLATSGGKKLN